MVEFANGAQANMRYWGSPYNPMVATCWAGTWTCVPKEDDSTPFMTMQNYAADVQDMGYGMYSPACGGMGMYGPAEAGFLSSLGQQFAMNGQAADQNYMSQALLASQNTMVGMQGALNEIAASPDVSDADAAKAGEYADKIAEKMDEINDIKTDDTLTNQERSARIRELQRDIKQIEREAKTLVENYQAQKGFNTAIDSYVSKLDSQSNALDELAKKAGATSDQQEKAKTLKKKIDDNEYNGYLDVLSKHNITRLFEIFSSSKDKVLVNPQRNLLFDAIAYDLLSLLS